MLNGFQYITETRFIVNPDQTLIDLVKKDCKLLDDERILLLIDDSFFKNKTKYIVLTNKRILWKRKYRPQLLQEKDDNSEKLLIETDIESTKLKKVSVYVKRFGKKTILTLLDENITFNFCFNHINNTDILRIIFLDYISNYSLGYSPVNKANDQKYKQVLKVLTKKNQKVLPVLINFISLGLAAFLLIQKIFILKIIHEPYTNVLVIVVLLCKLLSNFSSGLKSKLSNTIVLLIFSLLYGLSLTKTEIDQILVLSFFIATSILFLLIDFDKLIKIIISLCTIVVTLYLSYILLISI